MKISKKGHALHLVRKYRKDCESRGNAISMMLKDSDLIAKTWGEEDVKIMRLIRNRYAVDTCFALDVEGDLERGDVTPGEALRRLREHLAADEAWTEAYGYAGDES